MNNPGPGNYDVKYNFDSSKPNFGKFKIGTDKKLKGNRPNNVPGPNTYFKSKDGFYKCLSSLKSKGVKFGKDSRS